MKILLGGVPFGRNNIGDEAILANVVRIVRAAAPTAEVTVSTDDPSTADLLGVQVCPLYGFDVVPYSEEEMHQTMAEHEVFLWAGATGLSDYPDRAVELLSSAREARCRRIVWNVGMNSELNPAKYRLRGKRLALAQTLDYLSGGIFSVQKRWESSMESAARSALARELNDCALLVVRDPESANEVARCGVAKSRIITGADSALIQSDAPWPLATLSEQDQKMLDRPGIRRVALCISAQREISRWDELVAALDAILCLPQVEVVGLPMNPITDLALLQRLRQEVAHREKFQIISGVTSPADITTLAGKMDVIISSRLHLLILGSIHHVPLIGISRGSKVDNFLAPFGLKAVGSVEACDFPALIAEVQRLLDTKPSFVERSQAVRAELLARLDRARHLLRAELQTEHL